MQLITPLLAQADLAAVPGEFLKNIVLCIAAGLAIAVYARDLFGSKKKREVSFEFTPASKEEFDRHVAENMAEFKALHEQRESDNRLGGESRKRIYDKLDELQDDMNTMPGRIVADIVNAKRLFDK